jgi:hypothetical protein
MNPANRRPFWAAVVGVLVVVAPYSLLVAAANLEPLVAYPLILALAVATAGATWVAAEDPPNREA